jgi:hypothetical protein
MDELNHLGWVVYKSYEFAGHLIGIRTNSDTTGEWLDETFKAYEVTDEEAEPYYSLYMADEDEAFGSRYNILYREGDEIFKSFDPAGVARRLVAELNGLALKRRDDAVFLDSAIVGFNGLNALVPAPIIPYFRMNGRKVEKELALPDAPYVAVDKDSGRPGAIPSQIEIPEPAYEDLSHRFGGEGGGAGVLRPTPETIDLVCAFHWARDAPPVMPLSRALAVYHLAQSAVNLRAVGGEALYALAKVVEDVPSYLILEETAADAYALFKGVLEGTELPVEAAAAG